MRYLLAVIVGTSGSRIIRDLAAAGKTDVSSLEGRSALRCTSTP